MPQNEPIHIASLRPLGDIASAIVLGAVQAVGGSKLSRTFRGRVTHDDDIPPGTIWAPKAVGLIVRDIDPLGDGKNTCLKTWAYLGEAVRACPTHGDNDLWLAFQDLGFHMKELSAALEWPHVEKGTLCWRVPENSWDAVWNGGDTLRAAVDIYKTYLPKPAEEHGPNVVSFASRRLMTIFSAERPRLVTSMPHSGPRDTALPAAWR